MASYRRLTDRPKKKVPSARGEYIDGVFISYRDLAEEIDRGFQNHLRKQQLRRAINKRKSS